jgi:hypothetical protein
MSPVDVTRLIAGTVAHLVAFWAGLSVINVAVGLGARNVPAPYTLDIAEFKKSRKNRDLVAFWLGAAGVTICLVTAISLLHFFW